MNNELHKLREKWEASFSALECTARGAGSSDAFRNNEFALLREEVGALKAELVEARREREASRYADTRASELENAIRLQTLDNENNRRALEELCRSRVQEENLSVQAAEKAAKTIAGEKERAESLAEELFFARAENEALRQRVAAADAAACDARAAAVEREKSFSGLLERLNRAESECERISQNFIQYRMEIITRGNKEERHRRHSEPVLGEKIISWLSNKER